MPKAFLLDLVRCIGCKACVVGCKTGNELDDGRQYIDIGEHTEGTFPDITGAVTNHRCFHCTDAACVAVCPTGALYKEDGLTRLNRDACSGCEYCTQVCEFKVPKMVGGRSSKCDGCAATTDAGGVPWCVRTCPSHALLYGERAEMLAEARGRVAKAKGSFPEANLYGETQAGGLGLLVVLPKPVGFFGLPENPKTPPLFDTWQKWVQPISVGLAGSAFLGAGLMSIIARRNHVRELEELHAAQAATGEGSAS